MSGSTLAVCILSVPRRPTEQLLTTQPHAGCYSLARLLDEGVVAGCEGDVPSALGMASAGGACLQQWAACCLPARCPSPAAVLTPADLPPPRAPLTLQLWGRLMTRQVPWMANVVQADVPAGILKLAHVRRGEAELHFCCSYRPTTAQQASHTGSSSPPFSPLQCTIARSLLQDAAQPTTHFESGLGVAFKGTVPPGSVTLLRIGGAALDRLWCQEGYLLREEASSGGEWSPHLCRTQVRRGES